MLRRSAASSSAPPAPAASRNAASSYVTPSATQCCGHHDARHGLLVPARRDCAGREECAWPGIGSYAVEALIGSDYAPVQGFVLTMALLYVALNLAIDLVYRLVDPRVRLEA